MRTTDVEKTRKRFSTTGLILISKSFHIAVVTAGINSHICFTRHAKEKKKCFISISRWHVLNDVFSCNRLFW